MSNQAALTLSEKSSDFWRISSPQEVRQRIGEYIDETLKDRTQRKFVSRRAADQT